MTTEIVNNTQNERTLRDEIAIAILPLLMSEEGCTVGLAAKELGIPTMDYEYRVHWPMLAARRAYSHADAMMRERSGSALDQVTACITDCEKILEARLEAKQPIHAPDAEWDALWKTLTALRDAKKDFAQYITKTDQQNERRN